MSQQPQELVAEVERRLGEIDSLPDPRAQEAATATVQALLELYAAGLERIVDAMAARDEDGELAAVLAGDELVSHLLLLHGLHPETTEQRVLRALEEVRPMLETHGGDVELVGLSEDQVHLRLQGSCRGCPSSTVTLKLAIEEAIHKAAPEIVDVLAQDAEPPAETDGGLLQIEMMPGGLVCPTVHA